MALDPTTQVDREVRRPAFETELWWGMAAGPLAWAFDLGFSYALTQHSCSTGHFYVLHLITWICFALALTGTYTATSALRRLPDDVHKKGERPRDRAYFLAKIGIATSIAFAIVIVAATVPRWILSPCE